MSERNKYDLIKVHYDSALRESRLILTRQHIEAFNGPHNEFIRLAAIQMEEAKDRGEIYYYETNQELFHRAWERLAAEKQIEEVSLILASGSPKLKGLSLDFSQSTHNTLVTIHFNAELETAKNWQPIWIERTINFEMRRRGYQVNVCGAGVHAAWLKMLQGSHPQHGFPIGPAQRANPRGFGKTFTIKCYDDIGFFEIILGDVDAIKETQIKDFVESATHTAAAQLAVRSNEIGYLEIQKQNIIATLARAKKGPPILNLELPIVFLGGLIKKISTSTDPLENTKSGRTLLKKAIRVAYGKLSVDEVARGFEASNIYMLPGHSNGDDKNTFHFEILELAARSLTRIDTENRYHQALTLPLDTEGFAQILRLTKEMFISLGKLGFDGKSKEEVWFVNLQIFPLTRLASQTIPHSKSGIKSLQHDHSSWLNLVVREMITLKGGRHSPAFLAAQLIPEVSPAAIESSLEKLTSQGWIIPLPALEPRYQQTVKDLTTDDDLGGKNIVNLHQEVLVLAKNAFANPSGAPQEFWSIPIALPKGRMNELKEICHRYLENIFSVANQVSDPDQLYQTNVQILRVVS